MSEYPQVEAVSDGAMLSRRNFLLLAGVGAVGVTTSCSEPSPYETFPPRPDCADTVAVVETRHLGAESVDLANELTWDVPGVEKQGTNLLLTPISTAVYNKESDTYQPIQRFNTHHRIDGDAPHEITAQFASHGGRFSLALSEDLPLIYDDFVLHSKGITLTFEDNALQIEAWDGKRQQPAVHWVPLMPAAGPRNISVRREAAETTLLVGEQVVDLTPLTATQLWLGVSAANGPVEVTGLGLAAKETGLSVTDMNTLKVAYCTDGLQQAALHSKARLGVAISRTPLLCDARYAALVGGNFGGTPDKKGSVTFENALKPQFTQPEEGVFTLQEARQLVDFATRHNMTVHGHALIPNRSFPKWMADLPTDTPAEKQRVKEVMINHIKTLVRAFPEITSWDLFNEPRGWEGWNDTPFFSAMDTEMFEIGLRAALEANPKGEFWFNDFAMDKDGDTDEARFQIYRTLLKDLDRKGLRAAGLGMEGHVQQMPRDNMSADHIRRRVQVLREDGKKARISEMDVVTYIGEPGPTTEEGLMAQAEQFKAVGEMCAREGIDFTTWCIGGKYVSHAWIESGELRYNPHTLWDEHMRQRPAYSALQKALR